MAWNFGDEVQFGGGECHGARYITHFYCLAVEAGFYSDVVECLPVDPASWVRFSAGAGKIFSLYDKLTEHGTNTLARRVYLFNLCTMPICIMPSMFTVVSWLPVPLV